MKKILIVCSVALLLAVNAWADTVTFKSGKKIEGNIKSITNDSVTVDLYGVTEMTYELSDIQEINGQVVELKKPAGVAEPPAEAVEAPVPPAATEAVPAVKAPEGETVEAVVTVPESDMQPDKMPGLATEEMPKVKLTDTDAKLMLGALGAFLVVLLIIFLVTYIYSAICLQIIAKKTDTQYGWMAWIPIANLFLMCNIGKVKYLWLLLILASFVPVVGRIVGPLCNLFLFGYLWYMIALARGKEGWVGAITLIPVVGLFTMGYLAFSQGAAPLPNIGDGQPAKLLGTAPPIKPPIE